MGSEDERAASMIMAHASGVMHRGETVEAASLFREAGAAARSEGSVSMERDALMGEAEALWHAGNKASSLDCYDKALELAKGDDEAEGMICIGKGYALLSIGRHASALASLERALSLCAEASGPQATFVRNLVEQARSAAPEGSGGQEGQAAAQAAEGAAKRAYARGALEKSTLVAVLEGTPWTAEGASAAVVKHLTSLSAMFTFVDVSGDAALEAAFEEAAGEGGGGGAPLLFVCGELFGGYAVFEGLASGGGDEALRHALDERLVAMGVAGDALSKVFSAVGSEWDAHGGCDGGSKKGETGYSLEHRKMLLRLVSRIAAEVKGTSQGPGPDSMLASFLEEVEGVFVEKLSEALGGFELPHDLVERHLTAEGVVGYIVEHCPAQGDCNSCPTKEKCKAHDLARGRDIEDLEGPNRGGTKHMHEGKEGGDKGGKKGTIVLSSN